MLPDALRAALTAPERLVIAVSGGVDSLTLAAAAARARPRHATLLCHAQSPAVPADALARVHEVAARTGLELRLVDAGEFADPAYRANPVNRCFFCKTNLYGTLSRMGACVASGTNLDDLGDYRPGLEAASDHKVLHPFVAARMGKAEVRALARDLGLGAVAEMPSSPCLASRVRTGLPIEAETLGRIDRIESALRAHLGPVAVRCRQEEDGLVLEIEANALDRLSGAERAALADIAGRLGAGPDVPLRAYRRGSAFVHA